MAMPTVYWVSYKQGGKLRETCHNDLLSAQREASGAMMGTKIQPKIEVATLQKNGTWKRKPVK